MSHPTDMLPYGELLADAGLIARLLDDGALSLAEDDSLSDEKRVVIRGTPDGLSASLKIFPCEDATLDLLTALEDLKSGGVEFFWEGGFVGCGEVLPWTPSHEFPLADLRSLFTRIARGSEQESGLRKIAEASPSQGAGGSAPLPPSFLPGKGQADRGDGVTQRYGAIDATPGRAEIEKGEVRYSTGRYQQEKGGGGGGGMILLAVGGVGLVLLLVVGAGGFYFFNKSQSGFGGPMSTPVVVRASPIVPATPEALVDPDSETDPDVDRPRPTRKPKPKPKSKRDPYVLAASVNEGDRLQGLKRWRAKKLDLREGARLKMLQTLDGRQDRKLLAILLKSIRESPLAVLEAIDCLELVAGGSPIWRELVEGFGRQELSDEELDVVADVLAESGETKDLLIDETLLRLGRGKDGGGARLLASRGVEWLQVGEGQELFSKLPLAQQAELLSHEDPKARLIGVKLVGATGREGDSVAAVKFLSKHLASKDTELKRRAIEEIGTLGEGIGAWYLALAMMRETDRRSLELLRNAVARIPSKEAIAFLEKLAAHKLPDRRRAAVGGLRVIKHPDSIDAIMKAVRDTDRTVRLEALSALANFSKDSEYKVTVARGVLDYRRIAKDRKDPEARRLARQLCLDIDGRLPR